MTEQSTDERALAAALGSYVTGVEADPNVYTAVHRWRRRRRRITGVVAAVVVLAAAAVPLAAYQLASRHRHEQPAGPPPVYVHSNGVRGSLGGNQQLLEDATRAVLAKEQHGSPWPDEIRPVYAERDAQHDVTVVLFTGTSPADPDTAFGIAVSRVGTGPWDLPDRADSISKRDPRAAAQAQQRLWGDPLWMPTIDINPLSMAYIAIVVPTDADAEIGTTTSISPGGIPQRRFEPLGLHAGTLLLDLTGRGSTRIVISKGREVLSTWDYRADSTGLYRVDGSLQPRPDQVAAAVAHARGHVDADSAVVQMSVGTIPAYVQEYHGLRMTFRIIWGGVVAHRQCVLIAMEFDSGALAPFLTCDHGNGTSTGDGPGLVPAGSFDRTTVAWGVQPGAGPYEIMAPPGAVRAEVEYADHTSVPVQLDNGFGVTEHPGRAVTVRVYDGGGHLMEQVGMDQNVHH